MRVHLPPSWRPTEGASTTQLRVHLIDNTQNNKVETKESLAKTTLSEGDSAHITMNSELKNYARQKQEKEQQHSQSKNTEIRQTILDSQYMFPKISPFLGDLFDCLFCCFTSQVNSYGHCGTVSSPNHTFSWAGLNKRLTNNSCTYFRL